MMGIPFKVMTVALSLLAAPLQGTHRDIPLTFVAEIEGSPRLQTEAYRLANNFSRDEMERKFGASGHLICSKGEASAELIAPNVIVTSAHVFWHVRREELKDENGTVVGTLHDVCDRNNWPAQCAFKTALGNKEISINVSSILSAGVKCPLPPRDNDDWAILILDKSVPKKIEPYKISQKGLPSLHESVLSVNGINGDLLEPNLNTGKLQSAKSFGNCFAEFNMNGIAWTTCSGAPGSSGSAILTKDREIKGIRMSGSETHEGLRKRRQKHEVTGDSEIIVEKCTYDEWKCASKFVTVEGAFLDALNSAVQSSASKAGRK